MKMATDTFKINGIPRKSTCLARNHVGLDAAGFSEKENRSLDQ